MKIHHLILSASVLAGFATQVWSATTIDNVNRYAYGANIGWMDFYADGTNGAVIGNYACSGYVYSANVGWICLGSGNPANGIYYANNSVQDYGVNTDGFGNLRGYAYGANIGWINFEDIGNPQVDLLDGILSGYVWSANCGWITLSGEFAYVQTDTLYPGPLAHNGLPVPWLLTYFGTTNVHPNADLDGTGLTVAQDYAAGLNPTDPNSQFIITSGQFSPGGVSATITWTSVLSRLYYIQKTLSFTPTNWEDSGLGLIYPDGDYTTRTFIDSNAPARFYRIQAVQPLAP